MACNGMASSSFFPPNFMLQMQTPNEEEHPHPPTSLNSILPTTPCTNLQDFRGLGPMLGKRSMSYSGIEACEEMWMAVHLHHPATFETLAMEVKLKKEVMEDLERFVRRKEFYKRIGKAWKRGYLLHGPPGTGKSSLVAVMANFVRFDVYDLELTQVQSNSTLRALLVGTANRSILVVEDIDCSLELQSRKAEKRANKEKMSPDDEEDKVTLSGLLNFVDGLWSSYGEERIIVFTTNYKDRLDPALLRPGRMDVHVHMTYCTPTGFRVLASNYHCLDHHPLFNEIEGLIKD